MPQVDQVRRRRSKKPLIVGLAVLAVVLVVGGVFLAQYLLRDTTAQTESVQKRAAAFSFRGKQDAAIAVLRPQLGIAKTDKEKLGLHLSLGNCYMLKKDYKMALAEFEAAAKLDPSYGSYEGVGRVAELAGDKNKALEYYRKARAVIKDGKAGRDAQELPVVEEAIKRLGGAL